MSWPTDIFILDLIWASVFGGQQSLYQVSLKKGSLEDVQQRISLCRGVDKGLIPSIEHVPQPSSTVLP